MMEKHPLVKVELKKESQPHEKSLVFVQNYSVDDNGDVVLSPIPEHKRRSFSDGKSLEISNLVTASMPDVLSQVQMKDQQDAAEYVTSCVVRRFGELEKQRENLKNKFTNNDNV